MIGVSLLARPAAGLSAEEEWWNAFIYRNKVALSSSRLFT
jgi:hypothetical protein